MTQVTQVYSERLTKSGLNPRYGCMLWAYPNGGTDRKANTMTTSKRSNPVDRILNLNPDQRTAALCYLAGYAPEAVDKVLIEMDRQSENRRYVMFTSDVEV